ncbi:Outer membrane protein TolC [Cyclonatronum proteinivorum]|uniref:Outer membrane protein TolC n=1 Tax=Cyclonatronum proteinivorum TaxID=1457365 RepID=A0A345UJQ6_9BACT|nr:TolC family protein [Cyclonatronum proteinivorum]AXJ00708.1 Outer membrane protein TolC [Cyclonatronum proteinivorum]
MSRFSPVLTMRFGLFAACFFLVFRVMASQPALAAPAATGSGWSGTEATADTSQSAPMTLEQAFERALQHNHAIRIERLTEEQARNDISRGNAGQLPVIELSGSAELSRNNTDLELANFDDPAAGNTAITVNGAESRTFEAGVNLRYTLFDGFSGRYRFRQLQQLGSLAELSTRITIEQTLFEVAQRYFQVLEAKEQLEIERENLRSSELRLDFTRDARQFGNARQLDVLNAEVNTGNDQIRVEEARNALTEAWRALQLLLGMEISRDDQTPALHTGYEPDAGLILDTLLQSALERNVRVMLSQSELSLAEVQRQLAGTGRFPELSLQGRYGYLNQENDANQLHTLEQNGFSASVNLRYVLFNGFTTRRTIENAAIERRSREENRIQVLRSVETDVLNSWSALQTQQRALRLSEQTVSAAELQFQEAQEAARQGRVTAIELRDAQLTLLEARLQQTRIRQALRLREIELLLLSGMMDI